MSEPLPTPLQPIWDIAKHVKDSEQRDLIQAYLEEAADHLRHMYVERPRKLYGRELDDYTQVELERFYEEAASQRKDLKRELDRAWGLIDEEKRKANKLSQDQAQTLSDMTELKAQIMNLQRENASLRRDQLSEGW